VNAGGASVCIGAVKGPKVSDDVLLMALATVHNTQVGSFGNGSEILSFCSRFRSHLPFYADENIPDFPSKDPLQKHSNDVPVPNKRLLLNGLSLMCHLSCSFIASILIITCISLTPGPSLLPFVCREAWKPCTPMDSQR
jgi:hypothetical protein